jgi:tryptophan-rich sensory protein
VNKISKLVICVVGCELAGILGTIFTAPAISGWYSTLVKPVFNPPSYIFAPVWTILYFMMGVSLYLVLVKKGKAKAKDKEKAINFFYTQLALNIAWSILFFGLHDPLLALIDIVFLWGFIMLTIFKFHLIDKTASLLLFPYLWWVSFAAVLNYSIWFLNR